MPIRSAEDLLIRELHSIEDAEIQAARALQKRLDEVETKDLRALLERRIDEGEHVLEDVRKSLEKLDGGRGSPNKAARGLLEETEKEEKEAESQELKSAIIIAGAQKLEHYCIASWGAVKAIAHELEEEELEQAMERALEEGYRWDREMTELAEGAINPSAASAEEDDEDEEDEEEEEASRKSGGSKGGSSRGKQKGRQPKGRSAR
jgi:ferritin-like metal-binding protein YciE